MAYKRYKPRNTSLAILALVIGLHTAFIPANIAQADEHSPRQHLEDATKSLLQAFELLLKSIPQYEAPEILENGDIIIRRKNSDDTDQPASGADHKDGTRT